ncbi:U11/U12 small nuclear ribonucleoprotein 25 kDa protein, partial [Cucurbita argyrosperma subsp. argyrosperma]
MGPFMPRIEPNIPDSCCISPRFRSNSFRRSLRYQRLPSRLLHLSVLKLDGSSFEVQVARKASVAKLREAVESVFCGMSMNREDVKISWPHVWSHFCLCYKHYKLIDEKSRIKRFGIRDGDLLHFVNRVA